MKLHTVVVMHLGVVDVSHRSEIELGGNGVKRLA